MLSCGEKGSWMRRSVSAVCNLNNGTGKVRIQVQEGGPALVREVRVPGGEFFPPDQLENLLGVSPVFRSTSGGGRKG